MRTTILGSVVTGFIALSLAACSGANVEPVDQSAQTETAHLDAPAKAGSRRTPSGGLTGRITAAVGAARPTQRRWSSASTRMRMASSR